MRQLREGLQVGLDHLAEVTLLLQRARGAHPTAGLYEAADLQWWWSQRARPTDAVPQLFWFDDLGRPEAAAVVTALGERMQLDPLLSSPPGSSCSPGPAPSASRSASSRTTRRRGAST